MTRVRVVLPLALLAVVLVVVSGRRIWLTGTATDTGVGATLVSATGADAVPGLIALALIVLAAAVASATAGPVGRRVALGAAALAAAGIGLLTLRALLDPAAVLGRIAARASGRSGTVPVTAEVAAWPYVVIGAAVLGLLAACLGLAGSGSWRGLSQRYDAPGDDVSGGRGQRVAGAWDQLDRGDDPTSPGEFERL